MENKPLDLIEKEFFAPAPSPFEYPAVELTPCEELEMAAGTRVTRSLNGVYQMIEGADEIPDFTHSTPANIPCTVQTALFEAGKIPDPMFGKNDKFAREEAYKIWWFKYEFDYDGGMIAPRLHFDGVCHLAHFYLNGTYLGEHVGMFGGPDYPVAELLQEHNTLIVKIENSPVDRKKYSEYADLDDGWEHGVVVNCVYGWHYACIPSRGIWQDVSLIDTPVCRFERPFILTEDYASGKLGVCLKSEGQGKGTIGVQVTPYNFESNPQCFTGAFDCKEGDQLHYTLEVLDPQLWWPNGIGEQPLYKVEVCMAAEDGTVSRYEDVIGIRQVEMRPIDDTPNPEWYNWRFFINGRYVFVKGTNWCTTDALLRCTEERYNRFLSLAKNQNLQLLRAWGGGLPETDYFYRKCDELGLMVQQEWPTCWHSPKTQPADALIETVQIHTVRLRNHPSLVRWAGGNEVTATDEPCIKEMGKLAFELDGTRPYHRTSPYAGSLHNYDTYWYMKEMDNAINLRAPFIGEFGMASCPNYESVARYVPAEELEMPIDPTAKTSLNYHTPRFNEAKWLKPFTDMNHLLKHATEFLDVKTVKDFVLGTQLAQCVGIRHTLEGQRADSPKAAGICYYKFTDVFPACSWATVDYYGVPKIPYYVLQDAFAPLHAMLNIRSTTAADSYPVVLLDDVQAAKGKHCLIQVIALNGKLEVVDRASFTAMSRGQQVQEFGVYQPSAEAKESMRILMVRLFADGEMVDDTFYFQNYEQDVGCYTRLPETKLDLQPEEGYVIVTNTSDVPAVGVLVENLGHDTEFTAQRNFICLLPGERRGIPVSHTEGLSVRALNAERI